MTLDELADAIIEVRRYVRTSPEHVVREVKRLEDAIREVPGRCLPKHWTERLAINLVIGRNELGAFNAEGRCVAVLNPQVLEGYLDGAAFEIRWHARRMAKEGGGG